MKRVFGVLIALFLFALLTPPAFAQEPRRGDRVCTSGDTLVASGETPDSLVLFGCGARIQSGAVVRKDIVSFGGDVAIEQGARITGDVVVFGGNADIAGQVGHRLTVFGGDAVLEPTAAVQENVEMIGGYLDQRQGAIVRGQVRGDQFTGQSFSLFGVPFAVGGGLLGGLMGIAIGFVRSVVYAISLAALGALVVVFMPQQTKQVSETALSSAMPSMGVGCLTLFVGGLVAILFFVSICGIPLGILLSIALVAAGVFGWIALGWLAGQRILESLKVREILPIVAVVVGVIVVTLVGFVPVIGWLVSLFLGLLGLGAVVLTRFGTRPYPPLAPAAAPALTSNAPAAPAQPGSAPAAPGDQSTSS